MSETSNDPAVIKSHLTVSPTYHPIPPIGIVWCAGVPQQQGGRLVAERTEYAERYGYLLKASKIYGQINEHVWGQ